MAGTRLVRAYGPHYTLLQVMRQLFCRHTTLHMDSFVSGGERVANRVTFVARCVRCGRSWSDRAPLRDAVSVSSSRLYSSVSADRHRE